MILKTFSALTGVSMEELYPLPQPVFLPLKPEEEEILHAERMADCEFDVDDIPLLPPIAMFPIPVCYVNGGPLRFAPADDDDWLVDE